MDTLKKAAELIDRVRRVSPLVHNITNYVTVNDCANVQLAAGGSPIMTDEPEDIQDITRICSALVVNIGTLNKRTVQAMHTACEIANRQGIPVVLDPVGAGASQYRNDTARELLQKHRFAAIRGNLSEISFLAGLGANAKGVDVGEADLKNDPEAVAKKAAGLYGCAVGITGKTDVITDGKRCFFIDNGTSAMKSVTGTGCMISALCGVFLGAKADGYTALCAAILLMGTAGEAAYAYAKGRGTGSLRIGIIDEISRMSGERLAGLARTHEKLD